MYYQAQTQISPRVLVVNTSSREAPAAITEAMNQQIRLVVVQTEDVSPHEMLRVRFPFFAPDWKKEV